MNIKKTMKMFLKDSVSFIVWGFLLAYALHWLPFPEVKKELENIFFESAAIKTICALFSITMLSAGTYLLIFGGSQKVQWLRKLYFENAVLSPAKFGMTFSAVSFGLFNGLSLAALAVGDVATTLKVFLLSLYLVAMAVFYWLLAGTISNEALKSNFAGYERLLGVLFIAASPLMALAVKSSV